MVLGASTMSAITQAAPTPAVPEQAHPVSEKIDATETLYRLTVREYERIGGMLDDDRVELIDGYLVKKMVKNPPHVIACRRVDTEIMRIAAVGWHTRAGDPIRISGRTEPEPDVVLVRGILNDYAARHPGPSDIALVVEVADTTLAKDRRRTRTYGPAGIPIYWIVNLINRQVEVYSGPSSSGYSSRIDFLGGQNVPVVIGGVQVGTIAVDAILP
jgi:Uma2 family endonuclease